MATNSSKVSMTSTVRILVLSDTHNTNPSISSTAFINTDLILHAGDLTNGGTPNEIQKQITWLRKLSGCSCNQCGTRGVRGLNKDTSYDEGNQQTGVPLIFIAGNHDISLDRSSSSDVGSSSENQHSQFSRNVEADKGKGRFQTSQNCGVTYLENNSSHVQLHTKRNGIKIGLSIFGTPMSPLLHGAESKWNAFTYQDTTTPSPSIRSLKEAEEVLDSVSLQTSILLSHSPPYKILDIDRHGLHTGCPLLWRHIQRVKPRLVVCGHRHEGRGCVKIVWNGNSGSVKEALRWKDPGQGSNTKLSLVSEQKSDLWEPFDLQGEVNNQFQIANNDYEVSQPSETQQHSQNKRAKQTLNSIGIDRETLPADSLAISGVDINQAEPEHDKVDIPNSSTLIVNASIMGTSYQRGLEKKFNKPIFVDLII